MITFFLGGARSGKSEVAERFAARLPGPVSYFATYVDGGEHDPDMAQRIAHHRARRPGTWETCEVGQALVDELHRVRGTVLVDALGTWVAGAAGFGVDAQGLQVALRDRRGDTVVVSEEVGLGVHPSTALGGQFREMLGRVNQAVAAVADDVWLVVAGRLLRLEEPGW